MHDAPPPADVRFTRDPSAFNASSDEEPESDPAYDSAYIPPRAEPLGTLPQSTGMPISAFQLGDEPTRP